MKLFQRLLVAPAALGLLSPLAANATEINLNEIANYSDVESIEIVNHFDNGVSLSGGYEFGDLGGVADTSDGVINYFLRISAPAGPGELGAALGTSGGQTEGETEELMYEAYYSYPVNDGMTITPLIYIKEQATAGTPDQTGVMVKTSFSF